MRDDEDRDILGRLQELVDEEHRLRREVQSGSLDPAEEQRLLADVQRQIDQHWDLLRQRRARREMGENPDDVELRTVSEVERYQQ